MRQKFYREIGVTIHSGAVWKFDLFELSSDAEHAIGESPVSQVQAFHSQLVAVLEGLGQFARSESHRASSQFKLAEQVMWTGFDGQSQ